MKTMTKKSSDSKTKNLKINTKSVNDSEVTIHQNIYEIDFKSVNSDKPDNLNQAIWLNIPVGFKL